MTNYQALNWVYVAQRLVQYINDIGPNEFSGVLDVLAYLDNLESLASGEPAATLTIDQQIKDLTQERDHWRKLCERLAGWGTFNGEAECALHEYRQAIRGE